MSFLLFLAATTQKTKAISRANGVMWDIELGNCPACGYLCGKVDETGKLVAVPSVCAECGCEWPLLLPIVDPRFADV